MAVYSFLLLFISDSKEALKAEPFLFIVAHSKTEIQDLGKDRVIFDALSLRKIICYAQTLRNTLKVVCIAN